jgi:hypothetical protein
VHTEISAARIFYVCRHMVANSKRQVWSIFKSMLEGERVCGAAFKLALEDQQYFLNKAGTGIVAICVHCRARVAQQVHWTAVSVNSSTLYSNNSITQGLFRFF